MARPLTVRETELALLLGRGSSYDELAARYKVHRNSIYFSLRAAKKKLGIKSNMHLVAVIAIADYKRKQAAKPQEQ